MKTKPQLCARKMWANYYADGTCRIHSTKKNAWSWRCFTEDKSSVPAAVPVAVIPLDDPLIVPALAALGIRLSKGGRK
tara:strand:+ start:197 stop:430 length:234 start_codon:yes stop_codon:yes gene_type:complete